MNIWSAQCQQMAETETLKIKYCRSYDQKIWCIFMYHRDDSVLAADSRSPFCGQQ